MRLNSAKRRMLEGKPAIGAAAGLGAPLGAEILSLAGYDFVLVDNQHGAWDDGSTLLAVRSICLGPAVPMARVRQNDYAAIGRLLDSGMLGIVVPMVNSAEDARAAAHAVRYPPRGGRSVGAFGTRFYGPDYAGQVDGEVFLAVQIETEQAVGRVDEILAVEGVDGCWVGPGDLANTMGVDLGTPEGKQAHEAAIMKVLEACHRTGKIPGIAGGDNAPYWLDRGFLFVTSVSDTGLVVAGAARFLRELASGAR